MTAPAPLSESAVQGLELLHRGKVRDVYAIDKDRVLLVATDRISAFDCVLPTLIPRKGEVLTQLSAFWFQKLSNISANHLITTKTQDMPVNIGDVEELRLRSTLAHRTEVFPVECVVRGYLEGSGWKDYLATGSVSGHILPRGLKQCDRLLEPIFTPSTKASTGHDENISGLEFTKVLGKEIAAYLKSTSLQLYKAAAAYALSRGIIVADTKFEFGRDAEGNILLIDELLTPDSSRFWAADAWEPGHPQPSFDKQFVREYLETLDWDKTPPAPPLPEQVCQATSNRYLEAYSLLTGRSLPD
jgi:phosphoribosylaminoimidazole-succinocarboxamide synthase